MNNSAIMSVETTPTAEDQVHQSVRTTPERPTRGFGERVRRVRIERGFRTIADLSAAMASSSLTLSVLKNIESGRKADISVHHLLELADALRVTPLVLLFDVRKPLATTDLPGLPPRLAAQTNESLEYWMSFHAEDGIYDERLELRSADEGNLIYMRRARRAAAAVAWKQFKRDLQWFVPFWRGVKSQERSEQEPLDLHHARYKQAKIESHMRDFGVELPRPFEWEGRRLGGN